MPKRIEPEGDHCVECGETIHSSDDYEYSKPKKGHVVFIHKDCWNKLLKEGIR